MNATFSNPQQAQVTQLLFEGGRHIAYISPTGKFVTLSLLLASLKQHRKWKNNTRHAECQIS